jgi:Domain of unknown function (DUF4291)
MISSIQRIPYCKRQPRSDSRGLQRQRRRQSEILPRRPRNHRSAMSHCSVSAEEVPERQVRAHFTASTIRVYQAYCPEIAANAVRLQTFVAPFKRGRMTWIKPSFTWTMYRSGWATKPDQERILGIDLKREGFDRALEWSSPSFVEAPQRESMDELRAQARLCPVRIQWDPERDLLLQSKAWRAIQVGLSGKAVEAYLDQWIIRIEDVTDLARRTHALVTGNDMVAAQRELAPELPYPLASDIAKRIGCTP